MSNSRHLTEIVCAKIKNLVSLTDYRTSPLTLKVREIELNIYAKLKEENEMLDVLKAQLQVDIEKTQSNIIGMHRAVTASARPGKINYKHSKPESDEVGKLSALQSVLDINRCK